MTTVIYERPKDNPKGQWQSRDGKWSGNTWQDVHRQLMNWAKEHGCEDVHDTPVTPWSRGRWFANGGAPHVTTTTTTTTIATTTTNPEPDSPNVDDDLPFHNFDLN